MVMDQQQAVSATTGSRNVVDPPLNQLNPHSLGREFVRQYYTILNRSPETLYRFYSNDSSLIHGTLGQPEDQIEPVNGSQAIDEKIRSLNFNDSHAKICQVDSLETLQKGVVVQVTGELSSNGQPMRRFLQTFVLAPQSPTNYYVRNDIFRYLDDLFIEEDDTNEPEKVEVEVQKPQQLPPAPVVVNNIQTSAVQVAAPVAVTQVPAPPQVIESPPKQINGHPEKSPIAKAEPESPREAPVAAQVVQETVAAPVVPAKISWAARVADHAAARNGPPPVAIVAPKAPEVATPTILPPKVSPGKTEGPKKTGPSTPKGKKFDREASGSVEGEVPVAVDEKKPVVFADEQQVFVGNLPLDITEDQLGQFFSKFGAIADIRINRQNSKNGTGRTPNYGFVTFEDAKVVKTVLSQKPIYFNEHRFNVEEKRSQGRNPQREATFGNFGNRGHGQNQGAKGGFGGGFQGKRDVQANREGGQEGRRQDRRGDGGPGGQRGSFGESGGQRRQAGPPSQGGPPRGGPPHAVKR